MATSMTIKRVSLEDAPALSALCNELGYETKSTQIEKRLREILAMEDHAIFIAFTTQRTAMGWIHVFISHRLMTDPFAELGGLVVTQANRKKGIGRLLLSRAESWAKEKGYDTLRIRTQTSRIEAHQFYTRMGYHCWKEQVVFEKFLQVQAGDPTDQ
jgi:GNAT superfamily N-acetyltransferase